VRQSNLGRVRVKDSAVVIGWGPPKRFCLDQFVENALGRKVEDTASLAVDFVDKKLSGLSSAVQRLPRRWQVPRALRYDAVILASPNLREREKCATTMTVYGQPGKGTGLKASVLVESTKYSPESHLHKNPPPEPRYHRDNPYNDS